MAKTKIKAVLFDVDGVLLDSRLANATYFQNFVELHGYRRPTRQECDDVFALDVYRALRKLTGEKSEEKLQAMFADIPTSDYPLHLLRVADGAEETLEKLKKTYLLGVVTSRISEGLYTDLGKLVQYFKIIITYEDSRKKKPDPEPLLVAASRFRLDPEEIVYIGDADVDVVAAKAAKMKIIGFGEKPLEGADISVTAFREIPEAIASLERG